MEIFVASRQGDGGKLGCACCKNFVVASYVGILLFQDLKITAELCECRFLSSAPKVCPPSWWILLLSCLANIPVLPGSGVRIHFWCYWVISAILPDVTVKTRGCSCGICNSVWGDHVQPSPHAFISLSLQRSGDGVLKRARRWEMGFVLFSLDIVVNHPLSVSSLFSGQLYPVFASFVLIVSWLLLFQCSCPSVVNWEFTLCHCPCGYSVFLSVKGFQELFLCGRKIIKQGCIFELSRIYGLCILCLTFLKRKQNYMLIGDRCFLKKSLMKLCNALSCPSLLQCVCCGLVRNRRSRKPPVPASPVQPANPAPLPRFAADRSRDCERVLQLLLRFVRGEGRRACAMCLPATGVKQEERTSTNKYLESS